MRPTDLVPRHRPPEGSAADPFWAGLREHRLTLPGCTDCGATRWYLLPACSACGGLEPPRWTQLPGTAELFTWTRVERPFVAAPGPFTLGLLVCDGAEDVRLVAPISVSGTPRIGSRLTARYVALDDHTLPVFTDERSPAWSS